ncbi:MAG: ArsR/SmtB family transcription factor [Anaerolineales bacterium]
MNASETREARPVEFAKALADDTRQKIMELCCCRWCSVGQIVDELSGAFSQPTISHHLSVLREAGLVESRREGKQVFYTLNQQRVAMCCGQIMEVFAPDISGGKRM